MQASTDESNKALIKWLTDKDPLKSVKIQMQVLHIKYSVVHPVAYISGSFTEGQCRWPAITKECFGIFMSIKRCSFYLQNSDLLVYSDHKTLLKIQIMTCNTWGLETTTIPKCVKVQHNKGIAYILADSVSRLRAVGLYHDLNFEDGQQEPGTPFEPLAPVEQSTHTP